MKFFDVDTRTGFQRRFFDIGELAGVRMEDPAVFEATHALVLGLVAEGLVDGLRIDHPDGLADPAGYLERLRRGGAEHVWVEKILEPGEELRDWPVEGTVGYEFLNDVAALFLNGDAEAGADGALRGAHGRARARSRSSPSEAKLQVAEEIFEPELRALAQEAEIPNLARRARLVPRLPDVRRAVERHRPPRPTARRSPRPSLSDGLERILLLDERGHDAFVTRFQQTTGPVMAKGVEDTTFYRYLRLAALNEVGGDPTRMGMSVEDFHAASIKRALRFPRHLLTTQTHDTKRSADVRARIGALTWIPGEWRERVLRWRELNAPLREGPGAGRERGVPALPDARRRVADRARAARGLPREGAARGEGEHDVDRAGRGVGGEREGVRAPRARAPAVPRRLRALRRRGRAARRARGARPGAPEADLAGRPGRLQRRRAAVPRARRPRQPAAGRLGAPAPAARRGAGGRAAARRDAEARADRARARPAPAAARRVRAGLHAARRRAARAARSSAGGTCSSSCRSSRAARRRPARARRRPRAAGATSSPASSATLAGVVPVSELVDGFPVALLERMSGEGGGHTASVGESGWMPEGWEDRAPDAAGPAAARRGSAGRRARLRPRGRPARVRLVLPARGRARRDAARARVDGALRAAGGRPARRPARAARRLVGAAPGGAAGVAPGARGARARPRRAGRRRGAAARARGRVHRRSSPSARPSPTSPGR